MKLRPVILISLIIVLPLAALTWAVLHIARTEQVVVQQRFRDLMEDRLQDVNAIVRDYFEAVGRSLEQLTAIDKFDPEQLRAINRSEPRLLQLFVLNPDGQLLHPDPSTDLNATERLFLIQAAKMFTGQDLKDAILRSEQLAGVSPAEQQATARSRSSVPLADSLPPTTAIPFPAGDSTVRPELSAQEAVPQQQMVQEAYQSGPVQNLTAFAASSGWFIWYWDRGLNLIYWQRRPSGHIVGCALERARWMADLIGRLPETVDSGSSNLQSIQTRVRLVNSSADSVYQWGTFEPTPDARPLCEVPLAVPLASWRLQCFVPLAQLTAGTGQGIYLSLLAGLLAMIAALAVIAFLFVREYSRDMREASQQVSFVNQVSHELKTPLTNIRMYAELLDRDLEQVPSEQALKARSRLEVILSEGQRLSRLIGNVLTFARQKRKTLQVQLRPVVPDQFIDQILDRFRPAFTDQQIEVVFNGGADSQLLLDPDFLEQILGNLISNVEKYAASGGLLNVASRIDDGVLTVDVRDRGPGIESSKREDIFEPFARGASDLSYAAGTGIGLSIARELARLHGGDVVLLESEQGCWFHATIRSEVS